MSLVIDVVSLPVKCGSDVLIQATNCNGYHHDTMCTIVFCSAPTGKIICSCINYPGLWHDSQVCQGLLATVINNIGNHEL